MIDGLVALAVIAFVLHGLLDVTLTPPARVAGLSPRGWAVVVVFLPVLGGTLWLLGGRPRGVGVRPGGRRVGAHTSWRDLGLRVPAGTASPPPGAARPLGPDDDEAFLRHLDDLLRRRRERG